MITFSPNIYLDNLAKNELGKDSLNEMNSDLQRVEVTSNRK